jgi:hypothetical protein
MEERSPTLRPNRFHHTHNVLRVRGIPRVTFIVTVAPTIDAGLTLVIAGRILHLLLSI